MKIAAVLSGKHLVGELRGRIEANCRRLADSLVPTKKCRDPTKRAGVMSIKGPRPNNEDSAAVAINIVEDTVYGLVAIADGVGGKERGEEASAVAICHVLQKFQLGGPYDEEWLLALFHETNETVKKSAHGGATTLSVGILDFGIGRILAANVGDSPLYLIDLDTKNIADLTPNRDEYQKYITQAVGDKTYRGPHILKTNMPADSRMILLGVTDGVDDFIPRGAYLTLAQEPSPLRYVCSLLKNVKEKTRDNATAAAFYVGV